MDLVRDYQDCSANVSRGWALGEVGGQIPTKQRETWRHVRTRHRLPVDYIHFSYPAFTPYTLTFSLSRPFSLIVADPNPIPPLLPAYFSRKTHSHTFLPEETASPQATRRTFASRPNYNTGQYTRPPNCSPRPSGERVRPSSVPQLACPSPQPLPSRSRRTLPRPRGSQTPPDIKRDTPAVHPQGAGRCIANSSSSVVGRRATQLPSTPQEQTSNVSISSNWARGLLSNASERMKLTRRCASGAI